MRKVGILQFVTAGFIVFAIVPKSDAVGVSAMSKIGTSLESAEQNSSGPTSSLPEFTNKAISTGRSIGPSSNMQTYSKALDGLKGSESQSRGAREVAVYAQASPSVVLIVIENSLGSGTLIDSTGLILTNWHVVAGSQSVGVIFKPKLEGADLTKAQVIQGRVVRVDQVADLALVQVAQVPPQAHTSGLASSTNLQVGDDVHAIGHPTGEAWTYTRGIVSQIRRDYKWTTEDKLQHRAAVIQTQTPINPGNSGGPLLNNAGEVVGVNSFKGEGEGLNFAVSVDDVRAFLTSTASRTAKAVPTVVRKSSATDTCNAKEVKKWRMSDPPGMAASYDAHCLGVVDMIIEMPDDQTKPTSILLDSKHAGKIDIVLVDSDRDGFADFALYDTTGSGKPDLIGYFRNHESEPYRVEKYTEQ